MKRPTTWGWPSRHSAAAGGEAVDIFVRAAELSPKQSMGPRALMFVALLAVGLSAGGLFRRLTGSPAD